ncbi:uncharacterized protein K460DRAFT_369287 [Cucurbitaria berberidis CBS 394.84]|uniref:DUF4484 domain-containing protein n=1 Tax=Cucurbitaria berberidis CBS 394.84 TaxID=1168544 RepID=A0A9P4L7K9_9PLEO|nr:uncharacterized protein K460DRAFT_369287 [Cucurbitaria berberidis CBS 394.84]KAF1844432.1 hypothetical protein K460DRAFT_369287 [Cucurbitaria berberidis CBS 394.84]
MSASTDSSAANVETSNESGPPEIEALFLIRFDKKVGYTIAWKRSATDIALENAVEFKSLPSGLHAVQNDLVYFTHEGYAGLSAFAKGDASAEERNANFVSVGILVKNEGRFGRLGRAWLLAGQLEKLAAALADDSDTVTPLEDFWEEHNSGSRSRSQASDKGGAKGHSRARAISTVSVVTRDDESLPAYHPALSILRYMDTFGPLVFRLQQAALLRKRILFVASPPVRTACEYVYNLSVLSSISTRDSDLLIPGTEDLVRLPSLFSIGVHDIPHLEDLRNPKHGGHTPGSEASEGWAACTTDEIISTKTQLYDIVVELPSTHDAPPQARRWPRIRTSDGSLIRASQRDVARYKILHKELFRHRNGQQTQPEAYTDEDNDDTAPLLSRDEVDTKRADDDFNEAYDDSVVEPMTWSRLAYLGFMWWASAGERDAYTTAERDTDRELIGDLAEYSQSVETALIAYFHRQTSLLIQTLSQVIESERAGERESDEDDEGDALVIDRDDLSRMGLDTWSEADRAFVQEFGSLYFGRAIGVKGSEVDCCGLRVPVF